MEKGAAQTLNLVDLTSINYLCHVLQVQTTTKLINLTNKMKKFFTLAVVSMACAAQVFAADPNDSNWKTAGNASLQFTQGYVSPNWYKGGESNFALLAAADYTFNYSKEKLTWDNLLEGKLGFVTTPSDVCHNYMTNTDYLKLTSKVGYKAGGNWFYTLQAQGQTQFCPGFKSNTEGEISKFFSPAYLTVSLGMDWKKSTENIDYTVFLGPVAYSLKYVNDPLRGWDNNGDFIGNEGKIDGTQFGLYAGEFNAYDLGASAKGRMVWKICPILTWTSQATYFSPLYNVGKKDAKGHHSGYTTIDWENTLDMPLNKYFSTKVFTHLRFDDSVGSVNKNNDWGYFQFTELLSFGLSYHW